MNDSDRHRYSDHASIDAAGSSVSTSESSFAERWQSAVINLRLGVERVQSTADELPMHIVLASDRRARSHPANLLCRHMEAFSDYTTALNCVQALLTEYGAGER